MKTTVPTLNELWRPEIFTSPNIDPHAKPVVLEVTVYAVYARYPKNDEFRSVIKSLGYKWHAPSWERLMDAGCRSIDDIAAHTANALVSAGFPVRVQNPNTKKIIHDGSWTPMNLRTIEHSSVYRNFTVRAESGADEILKLAARLPRATRREYFVSVPESAAEELAEFAEAYGFVFLWDARKAVDRLVITRAMITPTEKDIGLPDADPKRMRHEEDLSDLIDTH